MTEARDIARQERGPVIDDLLASAATLRAENATLREDMVRSSEDMGRICAENKTLSALLAEQACNCERSVGFCVRGKEYGGPTCWHRRARAALNRKPVPAP